jgi:hypothetical protein
MGFYHNVYIAKERLLIKKVGSKTIRPSIAGIALLALAMIMSGCVNINDFHGAPTPRPVVTVNPTPRPTVVPTPAPTVAAPTKSSDVKVLGFYGDKGVTNFSFIKDVDYQQELITVMLRNDGSTEAKNVVLSLTLTDAFNGNPLIQQQFKVGDIPRGGYKEYTMKTDRHRLASSVYISVGITWGENGEYTSPVNYVNTAKTIWM